VKFSLPHNPWHENASIDIETPGNWGVEFCPMQGHNDAPHLTFFGINIDMDVTQIIPGKNY